MDHDDHVALIKEAVDDNGLWADFGSGEGAFTLALRDIAGSNVEIYSIDKDKQSLKTQRQNFNKLFSNTNIHYINQDFTQDLNLPKLDGIIMANSLHFVNEQKKVLRQAKSYLKKRGKLIVVEYNTDVGNQWVPYPLSFGKFKNLAKSIGYMNPSSLATYPSSFLNEIYSAVAYVSE